jgi:hypothetical protein
VPGDQNVSSALAQSIAFARQNQQVAIWDRGKRPYALGVYDASTRRVHPLSDEHAGIILNRDPRIAREWRRWNLMTQNQEGSLIVVDRERVRAILKAANEEPASDDDVTGLA